MEDNYIKYEDLLYQLNLLREKVKTINSDFVLNMCTNPQVEVYLYVPSKKFTNEEQNLIEDYVTDIKFAHDLTKKWEYIGYKVR